MLVRDHFPKLHRTVSASKHRPHSLPLKTSLNVFSFLRTLTTRNYPHSLAAGTPLLLGAGQQSIDIDPARRAHNSKPGAAGLLLCAMLGQT